MLLFIFNYANGPNGIFYLSHYITLLHAFIADYDCFKYCTFMLAKGDGDCYCKPPWAEASALDKMALKSN